MPLELITIPCLSDNYAFLLHNADTGETLLVDVPEAAPILTTLKAQGWTLTDVLLTHHHDDHVGGLGALLAALSATPRVIGGQADAHRLPPLDAAVANGDTLTICGEAAHVFDVSGHTNGHIAVHFPTSGIVFTADSLMALGCGRLFEGTPAQMWQSLLKLRALPDDTRVCSGHEYTQTNAGFAQTIEPSNDQLMSSPFLRADISALQSSIGMSGQDPVDVFTEIRKRRDIF